MICLVGLPASGKTTFANSLKSIIEENLRDYIVEIIDPDRIREFISSESFDPNKEPLVRSENLKQIRAALEQKKIVISDDLNYYTSMRHDLKVIAERMNINFFIIHIATPLEICLKWNEIRGVTIPHEIILDIHTKIDNFDKYKWEAPLASFDLSLPPDIGQKSREVLELIIEYHKLKKRSIDNREIALKKDRTHKEKLDKITRDLVGELLQDRTYYPHKKVIIKTRKSFLRENRNNDLNPSEIKQAFKDLLQKTLNIKFS